MRIAIVSDMHLGYERFREDAYVQAASALDKASGMADAVIMPGDIFDKRNPKSDVMAEAVNIFRELSRRKWGAKVSEFIARDGKCHTDVPVLGISGTHERTAMGKENPLNLLGLAGLIVDTSEATTILEKDGEKVAVYGLGGVSEERLRDTLKEIDPRPISGMFNIFMFHQSTYELLPFSSDFIRNEELPEGFDLYVDGHIHKMVEMEVHGKEMLIPGSTVLTQLKDGEQGRKGFIIYDTNSRTHEFVGIESRRFECLQLEFDGAKPKEFEERCIAALEPALKGPDRPIIRIKLSGTLDSGFSTADMPIHSILLRYSGKAIMDFDTSKLSSPGREAQIEDLRNSRIGNMSIKELGLQLLGSKLKSGGKDAEMDYSALFSALGADQKKEKSIRDAMALLDAAAG